MRYITIRILFILVLVAAGLAWNGKIQSTPDSEFVASAEARVGRPATPVSYAGVARRSPVGVNRVGNRGGPVNRVGRR